MLRTATCACGALKAHCRGEPARISVCHCLDCQRRTGSAFGVQATFAQDQVAFEGEAREFTRHGDEGHWMTAAFCPACGGTVWYRIERRPGMVSVPVGGFADPGFPEPRVSVYEARRHPWARIQTEGPIERLD
ncbi:conserved hypothetical protein [Phenylobacterium zucineum HLK1]|uniref:CENP-V/GFA domain-containing protein n=1 Tax=Phenylobacterium zucineum (strain HLK1) TaxID=450851 RepID=B4RC61_PHEZH|nr:GFA family protein [Phenylobacterium zucineum]ACG79854.1 conserved hypothetical protein [Phenylobacterium zucineum HLK1]